MAKILHLLKNTILPEKEPRIFAYKHHSINITCCLTKTLYMHLIQPLVRQDINEWNKEDLEMLEKELFLVDDSVPCIFCRTLEGNEDKGRQALSDYIKKYPHIPP